MSPRRAARPALQPRALTATNMGTAVLVLLLITLAYRTTANHVTVCITNCGQCKRMLGPYFKGPACAASCLASQGLLSPDCNNPHSLRAFLKRLY